MEKLSELTLILKNKNNIFNDIKSYQEIQQSSLKKDLNMLSEELEALKELVEEKNQQITVKKRISDELEKEVSKKNSEITQLKTKHDSKLALKDNIEKEISALNTKINFVVLEVKTLETRVQELTKISQERRSKLEEEKGILEKIKIEHEKSIKNLKLNHKSAQDKLNSLKSLHKSIKFLIDKKILKTPELQIIETLQGKSATSIDHIQKTTLIKTDAITSTILSLQKRGILQLDGRTGDIKIIKPISF